ncbi:hypothetical protein [Aquimarina aggregata]|uniref:hypothetical protein n=1 Tax=Aquimarina aggregata TaxID=1642818 RepID=UPI002490718E|nr:hypothetical protein [Aquimarina aggregata]
MQLIYVLIIISGGFVLFFGIQRVYKTYTLKDIFQFRLLERPIEFNIDSSGLFSLSVIGTGSIESSSDFKINIRHVKTGKLLVIKENHIQYRFKKDGVLSTEYLKFSINIPGKYSIELDNINSLSTKGSMLKIMGVMESKVEIENLQILIKEALTLKYKILSILLSVIGILLLTFGILLFFW